MSERRRAAVPGVRLGCATHANNVMSAADKVCTLIQQAGPPRLQHKTWISRAPQW